MNAFRFLSLASVIACFGVSAYAGPYEEALRRDSERRRDIEWQDRVYGWKNGSPFGSGPDDGANSFAAIAYSPSTRTHAFSYGCFSQRGAERAALARCKAPDARIVSFSRNAYTALAVGEDGSWGAGWGFSKAQAEANARAECQRHTTTPIRIVCWAFSGR
jgi:hypothetical protein